MILIIEIARTCAPLSANPFGTHKPVKFARIGVTTPRDHTRAEFGTLIAAG
jgi:hypothetical protein